MRGDGTSDALTGTEHPLYGDVRITGDPVTVGNVTIEGAMNTTPTGGTIPGQPILFVTVTTEYSEKQETDEERELLKHALSRGRVYHGGAVDDEIAALISLRFGQPCRSGGTNRLRLASTGRWQPSEMLYRPQTVPPSDLTGIGLLTPHLGPLTTADIGDTLTAYANCEPADAAALIRAARAYALGRWVVNVDPNETWLRSVSAIETAARRWQHEDLHNLDVLRLEEPELAAALEDIDPSAEQRVADAVIARGLRARRRFTQFLQHFQPPSAATRPAPHFQIPFDQPHQMERIYKKVYELRSLALHDATPFPFPMLNPGPLAPTADETAMVPSETSPITLQTWDHITRGAITAWWDTLHTS